MYNEKQIDVAYIGSSASYVYWQPLKAWNDCGFTSFLLATSSTHGDAFEYYIKETLRYHKPTLFIVELRPYLTISNSVSNMSLRNGSDSMSIFSPIRYEYLNHYFKTHNLTDSDDDKLSFYFDIAKYHSNFDALGNPENWRVISDSINSTDKGFLWVDAYDRVEAPRNYLTEERTEISEIQKEELIKTLDFCDEEELQVLFVMSPYALNMSDMTALNTLEDIVTERGYKCVNANKFLNEMKLDFTKDFYNFNHVNCLGAEKYTEFLERYIVENFDLPDHRHDEKYNSWNEDYSFFEESEKRYKAKIEKLQKEFDDRMIYAQKLRESDSLDSWLGLASDPNYILLIGGKNFVSEIGEIDDKEQVLRLVSNSDLDRVSEIRFDESQMEATMEKEAEFERTARFDRYYTEDINCSVNSESETTRFVVDDSEYVVNEMELGIVAIDHITGRVSDFVTLTPRNDRVELKRHL